MNKISTMSIFSPSLLNLISTVDLFYFHFFLPIFNTFNLYGTNSVIYAASFPHFHSIHFDNSKKLRPKRNETKSTKLCDEYEVHSFNYKRIDIHCGAQFTNNIFLTLLRLFFLHQSRVLVCDHIIFLLTFPFTFFFSFYLIL